MGCSLSKEHVLSLTWFRKSSRDLNSVSEIPHVDSRLPLNVRDVFKLKQSWRGLDRHMELTGVEIFVR